MFFKEKEAKLGPAKAGDVLNFKFQVKEAVTTPIEYIHKGCGCTTITNFDKATGVIEGTLDVTKAGYINGNKIRKSITVNFNDGEPEYQVNPESDVALSRINPDKMRQILIISGIRADINPNENK